MPPPSVVKAAGAIVLPTATGQGGGDAPRPRTFLRTPPMTEMEKTDKVRMREQRAYDFWKDAKRVSLAVTLGLLIRLELPGEKEQCDVGRICIPPR